MWPFKKKKQFTPKYQIAKRLTKVKVGKTRVGVVFSDGRQFHTHVYGYYESRSDTGYDRIPGNNYNDPTHDYVREPQVFEPFIHSSLECARSFLANIHSGTVTIVDDPIKTMESMSGIIIRAFISDVDESFSIEVNELYLEEIKK